MSNIRIVDLTTNTVHLNWSDVKPLERRGIITAYTVTIQRLFREFEEDDGSLEDLLVFEAPHLNLSVFNLDNYTEYVVTIVANTSIGAGPVSKVFLFETLENGKYNKKTNRRDD